jgi:formylglycine-generating enzyme required for sulfatase activity
VRERVTFRVPLETLGSTPIGFVRIVPGREFMHLAPYWIQEREVTAGEYLEFLNDPATQAEMRASDRPIRVPREGEPRSAAPLWERGADGLYLIPPDWRADWPALAVSYFDAEAYARWLTEQARRAGSREVYALPREDELEYAGHAGLKRHYPYGNTFRPKWARTCFAKLAAAPGPVLRFPLDESPLGVFDLGGSAFEWIADPWGGDAASRRLAGGAWGRSDPEMLKFEGGIGASPVITSGVTGFRLVMRREAEER